MRKLITLRLPEETIAKVKAQKGGYTRFIEDAINYRLRYFEKKYQKASFIETKATCEAKIDFEAEYQRERNNAKEPEYSNEERDAIMDALMEDDKKRKEQNLKK